MHQTYLKNRLPVGLRSLLAACTIFIGFSSAAQDVESVDEKGILYNRVRHIGATLHTNGIGINYRPGKHLTGYSYLMGDFQLMTMRHPKEVKTVNPFSDNNNGFIYGKANSLLILRTGIGKQKTINAKGDKGGVEISLAGYAGATWGLAKPIYLSIFEFSDTQGVSETVEPYNPDKHYPDNISGRAGYFKGIGEARLHPGLYSSFLLNLEFGKDQKHMKMIETGASIDVFAKPVQMMAFSPANSYFLTFFIRFLYGKQWNK